MSSIKMKRMTRCLIITVFLMILMAVSAYGSVAGVSKEQVLTVPEESSKIFPTLYITTPQSPFEDRELWQNGNITLTSDQEGFSFEEVNARVRGRGNSTWQDGPDKRPLRFRFEEARSVMGSGYVAKDWILLANHFDRSLLRNESAFYLAYLMGRMDFVPSIQKVHLYVNEEYMGVYLLTDERDVNLGRLEIAWNPEPSLSGFFLELDARAFQEGTENETFVAVNGLAYDIRFPSTDWRSAEHVAYIKSYLEKVSLAIRSQNFSEIQKFIDMDTFIDFYLIQELFKNSDVHSLSVFMYVNGAGEDRRLYMGPIWDFDTAAGNREQTLGNGPENIYVGVANYWYRNLMNVPEFSDAVAVRWNEIKDKEIAQTIDYIKNTADYYQAEFEQNFERHQIMGVPSIPSSEETLAIESFTGQVKYLTNWLEGRTLWLDDFFNDRLPEFDSLLALVEYYTQESKVSISVNNEQKNLNIPIIIMQDRTMLPLSELKNIFKMDIDYNTDTQVVIMNRGNDTISHKVGSSIFTINGTNLDGYVPSITVKEEVFIPIRIVADALRYEIQWQSSTLTVQLYDKN